MQTQTSLVQPKRIGELLLAADMVRKEELPIGLREAERRSLRLGEVLVMLQYLSAEDLENVLQAQTKINSGEVPTQLALDALKYASSHQVGFDQAVILVQEDANDKRGQYELELGVLTSRLEDIERSRGPYDRELGVTCIEIADRHVEFDRLEEAEPYYRRALMIFERSYGPRHLKVSSVQTKLGETLLLLGRFKEAENIFWHVFDITQGAWGENHVQVANCHKALARSLEGQYRLREAEQFYISSLRITEKVLGPDSSEATDLLRHLAGFWSKQGRHKPEHKRLGDLLVDAGLLTPEQLTAALTYSKENDCPVGQALVRLKLISQENLRPALQAQILVGDGVLPVLLATHALRTMHQGKVFEHSLRELGWEPDHFTTEELSMLIDAAEELVSAEAALGSDHAGVAVLSMKLGDLYCQQKRLPEAEPLYKRAVINLEKTFGARDAEVATALAKLSHLYLLQNRLEEAESIASRALAIRRAVHGDKHLDVAECMELIALAYYRHGNVAEAEELYRSAVKIKEEMLGSNHERSLESRERLAGTLFAQTKFGEAEAIYQQLVEARQAAGAVLNPSSALILQHLGEIRLSRQDFDGAQAYFKSALEIHEKSDQSSLAAAELMEKYAFLLEQTGRTEESRKMMDRAQDAKRLRT